MSDRQLGSEQGASRRRRRRRRDPTERQLIVLWVVDKHGPVTPSDVAYHLPMLTQDQARHVLRALWYRGLVESIMNPGVSRARAFYATARGSSLLGAGRIEEEDYRS